MLKWLVNSGWWLGNRHTPLRRGISLVFSLSSLVILTACTDYVSQIEDRYGEWKPNWPAVSGNMTDSRDGQSYKTVTIGSQTWMAENLNYKTTNSFCYEDNASNCTKYGRLYTWDAATTACPSDWRLPTKAEFETLIAAVGGESAAGKMLKATSGWGSSANGVDDYSFSMLPAGYKVNNGGYENEGDVTYFWTSTGTNSSKAYVMGLSFSRDAGLIDADKNYGFSVRCIKDEPVEKTSSSNKEKVSSSSKKVESSSSSVVQSVVDPSTVVVGNITDSRDGHTYKTVKIGEQVWMAENLNYETANSYCYNNNSSNCTKYGRLYTWTAAMDSAGTWSTNGKGCGYGSTCSPTGTIRGVCPEGWHLPSRAEWETLFNAVGGQSVAGTKLKSTSGWYNSGNGTDAFSFSALPAGNRVYNGSYYYEGVYADFWSSTEDDSGLAYFMYLYYGSDGASLSNDYKLNGYSVRCLKDDASGHLANSSSSLKKYSSSSTVKSSSSVKITSSSSAKIMSLSSSREQPKSSSSKVTPSSSSKKVVLSSSSTKQSSSSIDLDYYNRQMQGQKGSGLSWKASDGPFVQINENGVKTDWYYWTDSENGGSSGFNRGSVPNIADEKGSGKYTLKEVESIGGVGGKAVLGPSFMMKDSVFHVGSVESGFSGGSIKLPADKMLGLCLEYTNTFDYFVIQIIYDNDEANNWGRPEFHLPIATEKKIINLPWAVFQKISDWAFADVSVYDAIKVMKGVNFQAINNSSKEVFGEFVISKIGAYGTCDDQESGENTVGFMTDSRDGQTYKTVKIGSQTWMAENLNYETANSYCYNDNASNCTKYGRLYTWAAAMDSAGTWSTNGKGCGYIKACSPTYPVRGVCPQGWHLPARAEFQTLFTAVGGQSTAGPKLKSTSGWNYSSGNGTDDFSFSALPAGYRIGTGHYSSEGYDAYFWSSTEYSSGNAYGMSLDYRIDRASLGDSDKDYRFSVRCLQD